MVGSMSEQWIDEIVGSMVEPMAGGMAGNVAGLMAEQWIDEVVGLIAEQ